MVLSVVLGILLIISLAVNFHFAFNNGSENKTATFTQTAYSIQTLVEPQTFTLNHTETSTATSTIMSTVTQVQNFSTTTPSLLSIGDLAVARIVVGMFPDRIAIDSKTDRVFVPYYNGANMSLAVIDGATNSVIANVSNISTYQGYFPVVNSNTDMIYYGNAVINGSTNRIVDLLNPNMTFIAVDENNNLVFAANQSSSVSPATELYEINGTNDAIISSVASGGELSLGAGAVGEASLNSLTHMLYIAACFGSDECFNSGILAINDTNLEIISEIPINQIIFSVVADPASNLIFATASQNQLYVINGSTNSIVNVETVTGYANQFRSMTIAEPGSGEGPLSGELIMSGSPVCNQNQINCDGNNTIYVLSTYNYGLFATFVSNNDTFGGLTYVAYDSANNETYASFDFSNFVLALKIPQYSATILIP
jgi:hypothetical protein